MIELPTIQDIQKALEPLKRQLDNISAGVINQQYLTVEELSEYIKTPKSTIYQKIHDIPGGKKVLGKWLFKRSLIDRWLGE